MATNDSVVKFDSDKEQWTSNKECLNYYLITNEVTDDTKKCAILISGYGLTTLQDNLQLGGFRDMANNQVQLTNRHFDEPL